MTAVAALPGVGAVQWSVWTTTARLVTTDSGCIAEARALVERRLAGIDAATSRFRRDSEVRRIARRERPGPVEISAVLADLLRVALEAAYRTDGDVDPTLGAELVALGYDDGRSARGHVAMHRRATYRDVVLHDRTLEVPRGVLLDLGATAKARAADLCAVEVATRFGCGALVSLGGDLRVAGDRPDGGWQVLVQDGPAEPGSCITLEGAAAVATSSTLHRTWQRDGVRMHHILDPSVRRSAPSVWRTVSVAAPTCVEANVLTTAAVVRGHAGLRLLRRSGYDARLVDQHGLVTTVGGWPA